MHLPLQTNNHFILSSTNNRLRRISLSNGVTIIGGIVPVEGIEISIEDEKEEVVDPVIQNQQDVVDFYYKIKEFMMQHTEYHCIVPSKRKYSQISYGNDTDDESCDANTD